MTTLEQTGEKVLANVERVIVGKHHEVRLALVALLCRGHLLIEDVPGTGKTVLAKAIARSLGCSFRRIQFTPDLLPSDVTGLSTASRIASAIAAASSGEITTPCCFGAIVRVPSRPLEATTRWGSMRTPPFAIVDATSAIWSGVTRVRACP